MLRKAKKPRNKRISVPMGDRQSNARGRGKRTEGVRGDFAKVQTNSGSNDGTSKKYGTNSVSWKKVGEKIR